MRKDRRDRRAYYNKYNKMYFPLRIFTPSGQVYRDASLADKLILGSVRRADGCWERRGRLKDGYSFILHDGIHRGAHVWSYLLFVGPIPEDFEVDHLCFNRCCCNPAHLEAVTHAENIRRSALRKKFCVRGHPREGLGPCRDCQKLRHADWRSKPESKVKIAEWSRRHRSRPGVRERENERNRQRLQTHEGREKKRIAAAIYVAKNRDHVNEKQRKNYRLRKEKRDATG